MGGGHLPLLFDINGFRHALVGCLPDQIFVLFGDFVKLDNGQQLIFVVFENFRTKLVAVAVAHALLVDAHFHLSLLFAPGGPAGVEMKVPGVSVQDLTPQLADT
jgi:hypothetical protein